MCFTSYELLLYITLDTNSGYGKERRIFIWSMMTCQGSTSLELPKGLPALCRRTLDSEHHRYAIAWTNKLGTDPMPYGVMIKLRHNGEALLAAALTGFTWSCFDLEEVSG